MVFRGKCNQVIRMSEWFGNGTAVDNSFHLTKNCVKTLFIKVLQQASGCNSGPQILRLYQPFPYSSILWSSRGIENPLNSFLKEGVVDLSKISAFHCLPQFTLCSDKAGSVICNSNISSRLLRVCSSSAVLCSVPGTTLPIGLVRHTCSPSAIRWIAIKLQG